MASLTLFYLSYAVAFPVWAIWIVAPSSWLAQRLARPLWPCTVPAVLFVAAAAHAAATAGFNVWAFASLGGVRALLANGQWATAGWIHYVSIDTFVARWMLRRAPYAGYRLTPFLLLTFSFCPAGLLAYAAARSFLEVTHNGPEAELRLRSGTIRGSGEVL